MDFIDLKSQYRLLKHDIDARIQKVLEHGQYILGKEVSELEHELAAFCGTNHAVTCASGTDALVMALMARGISRGDIVFTTPFTFFATAEAIALVGATPVFIDVDPLTFNLDPDALDSAIRAVRARDARIYKLPRNVIQAPIDLVPRAVMTVDIFGVPAEYDRINGIAREHGLCVIEDAAQSFGATYKGRVAGGLADIGCTSFFPAKPLGAYGDGGCVFTDDDGEAATLRSIRVHGQGSDRYQNVRLGLTSRLDTIQAAVLLSKLTRFGDELRRRQLIAETYRELICDRVAGLQPPTVPAHASSAWAQYSVLADNSGARSMFVERLTAAGVPHGIYYPIPCHLQEGMAYLGYTRGDMPTCEAICDRVFALPMHPYLTESQIGEVVTTLSGKSR